MELIPILATIILVATISTFFLSIGAYILFKVREARGVRQKSVPPATIQAELVTPELVSEHTVTTRETRRTGPAFDTTHAPTYRTGQSTSSYQTQSRNTSNLTAENVPNVRQFSPRREAPISAVTTNAKKFVKVTSEGAPEQKQQPQQTRQGGNLKWR